MNSPDKIPTRPGVRCACTYISVFADSRYGRMNNVVCPRCFMNIYREKIDGPIMGCDIANHIQELKRVDVIQGAI